MCRWQECDYFVCASRCTLDLFSSPPVGTETVTPLPSAETRSVFCSTVALQTIAIFIQTNSSFICILASDQVEATGQISYQSAIGERVSSRNSARCLIHFGRILSAVRIVRILQPVKTQRLRYLMCQVGRK